MSCVPASLPIKQPLLKLYIIIYLYRVLPDLNFIKGKKLKQKANKSYDFKRQKLGNKGWYGGKLGKWKKLQIKQIKLQD